MPHYRDRYPPVPNGTGLDKMKMQNDSESIDFEAAVAHLEASEDYLVERARLRKQRLSGSTPESR